MVVSELGDGEVLGYNGRELRCYFGATGEGGARKMQMVRAGQCGWVLARLRRSLARLGHTRQGTGDARRPLATTRRLGSEPVGH